MDALALQVEFGRVVQELRRQQDFSQESFADVVGVHRTYMGSIERGERNVSLRNLVKIADALKTPLSSLIASAESRVSGAPDTDRPLPP